MTFFSLQRLRRFELLERLRVYSGHLPSLATPCWCQRRIRRSTFTGFPFNFDALFAAWGAMQSFRCCCCREEVAWLLDRSSFLQFLLASYGAVWGQGVVNGARGRVTSCDANSTFVALVNTKGQVRGRVTE